MAFHTANHLTHLKDAARIRAENEVDKDLHDITIKDIIQGVSANQHNSNQSPIVKNNTSNFTNLDIQSRFLSFGSQALDTIIPFKKIDENVKSIASGNLSELSNIESFANEGADVLQNIMNKSVIVLNSTAGQIANPESSINLTNIQDTVEKTGAAILNPTLAAEVPSVRLLLDSDVGNVIYNGTHRVNEAEKNEGKYESIVERIKTKIGGAIPGHSYESSTASVIKREMSPVPVSISTRVKNQMNNDHISVGNFSTSNITDSSNGANIIKGETDLTHNSWQRKIYADKDNEIMCANETRDIFEYIFDDNDIRIENYNTDGMGIFEEMKLQDFFNQLIDTP